MENLETRINEIKSMINKKHPFREVFSEGSKEHIATILNKYKNYSTIAGIIHSLPLYLTHSDRGRKLFEESLDILAEDDVRLVVKKYARNIESFISGLFYVIDKTNNPNDIRNLSKIFDKDEVFSAVSKYNWKEVSDLIDILTRSYATLLDKTQRIGIFSQTIQDKEVNEIITNYAKLLDDDDVHLTLSKYADISQFRRLNMKLLNTLAKTDIQSTKNVTNMFSEDEIFSTIAKYNVKADNNKYVYDVDKLMTCFIDTFTGLDTKLIKEIANVFSDDIYGVLQNPIHSHKLFFHLDFIKTMMVLSVRTRNPSLLRYIAQKIDKDELPLDFIKSWNNFMNKNKRHINKETINNIICAADAIIEMHKKNERLADDFCYELPKMEQFLGKYFSSAIEYFKRRMPISEMDDLCTILEDIEELPRNTLNYLSKTDFGEKLGKKKIKALLNLIQNASLFKSCGLRPRFSDISKTSSSQANRELEVQLKNKLEKKYKIEVDYSTLIKFKKYLPYFKEQDNFSNLIQGILTGSFENKDFYSFNVEVVPDKQISLENILKELSRLTDMYNKITNENRTLTKLNSLDNYVDLAKEFYKGLRAWKSRNADKLNDRDLKELEPNLERLTKLKTYPNGKYTISFAPDDIESQLIALSKVPSCLSPGRFNFKYSKHYLIDVPGVFFAVIKDSKERIVGRSTIAIGYDKPDSETAGRKYVARVAYIYPESLGITEELFNSALEKFARAQNAEVLSAGEMYVPGIGKGKNNVYDDLVRGTSERDKVVISRERLEASYS